MSPYANIVLAKRIHQERLFSENYSLLELSFQKTSRSKGQGMNSDDTFLIRSPLGIRLPNAQRSKCSGRSGFYRGP